MAEFGLYKNSLSKPNYPEEPVVNFTSGLNTTDRRAHGDSTARGYIYMMLRIYVAHSLMYLGVEKAKIVILNSLTDLVENYIKEVAKDSKRCNHLLCHKQPNLVQIIRVLKTNGLPMDVLIESCIQINLKKYTKEQCLANEKTREEWVKFYGSPEKENQDKSCLQKREMPIHCACVQEFLELEPVRIMAEKDLKRMFNMEPFKLADASIDQLSALSQDFQMNIL